MPPRPVAEALDYLFRHLPDDLRAGDRPSPERARRAVARRLGMVLEGRSTRYYDLEAGVDGPNIGPSSAPRPSPSSR